MIKLLTRVIAHGELPICNMLLVQLLMLIASVAKYIVLSKKVKSNVIDVAIEELEAGITLCNVLSKNKLEAASSN